MPHNLKLDPPRRWALAIGVPFALAAVAYGGFTYVALVGQDSYNVHAAVAPVDARVTVGIGCCNLTVVPSPDGRDHLSGVVSYSLVRPQVHWEDTATGSVLEGPNCRPMIGNCGATFTLAVPLGQATGASTGSGNVQASRLAGALTLKDGSGNIVMDHLSGPLVLSDSSGDITGTDLSAAKVQAHDGSGDVELSFDRAPDEVKVSDSSGDITVEVPTNARYYIEASTSSGSTNIAVASDRLSQRVIYLTDGSGDIQVVPAPAST